MLINIGVCLQDIYDQQLHARMGSEVAPDIARRYPQPSHMDASSLRLRSDLTGHKNPLYNIMVWAD